MNQEHDGARPQVQPGYAVEFGTGRVVPVSKPPRQLGAKPPRKKGG